MILKVKYKDGMPELYSKDGDSGYDLRAYLDTPIEIKGHQLATIPTGISLEPVDDLDEIYVEIQIRPRSGLTSQGLIAQFGTVDESYRGEIKVTIYNATDNPMVIQPLTRIAQMVVCPIFKPKLVKVDYLSQTDRGSNGFGSSGIN